MPVNQLTNPLAEEGESASYSAVVHTLQYDPAASGNLVNGNLVVIETTTSATPGAFLITKSTTTPVPNMLGIVVGAPTGGYAPGSSVQVLVEGIAQALFGASTTAAHYALSGTGTAGTLIDSATATNALTMGVILQTLTISSGTALVWVYIHRT